MNFILELYPSQVMFGAVYGLSWAAKIALKVLTIQTAITRLSKGE